MTDTLRAARSLYRPALWRLLLALAAAGCSRTTELLPKLADGAVDAGSQESGQDAAPDLLHDASIGVDDAGAPLCGSKPCACANGLDDDDDGLVDGFDPECTGPFDDDEKTFSTGTPANNSQAKCLDCFFDNNAGWEDDGCRYPRQCLDGLGDPGGNGPCATCSPSQACADSCLPRTPNGCDCFGCCEVSYGGSTIGVLLRDTCSLADVSEEEKCPRCQPSPECKNECGPCELCLGKTEADLPASCREGGIGHGCDDGPACGTGAPCERGYYCLSGCCVAVVL
jgi:hypothetical protein